MSFKKLSSRNKSGKLINYLSADSAGLMVQTPDLVFGTDLVAWFRSDGVIASGNKVSQWTDRSGNNFHALQTVVANQPTLVLNGFNNKPAIRFDYLDVWFNMPSYLSSSWGQASLFITLYIKDQTRHWAAMKTGTSPDAYWGTNSAFNFAGFIGEFRSSRIDNQPSSMSVVGNHFIEIISGVGNAQYKVFRNNVSLLTANPLWAVTSTPYIGRDETSKRMNGDIAEIIVVKKAATDSQRQEIQRYVKSFWGLTF